LDTLLLRLLFVRLCFALLYLALRFLVSYLVIITLFAFFFSLVPYCKMALPS
jgi:hypothetical protein